MTINNKSSEYDLAISRYNDLIASIKKSSISDSLHEIKEFSLSEDWKHLNFTQKFDLYASSAEKYVENFDHKNSAAAIALAKQTLKLGTDFERSNKLHIIEGVFMVQKRKFREAAELLIQSIPTYNCDDFISIEKCVIYSVFTELLSFSRSEFKATIVSSATIRQITQKIPYLDQLIQSYISCDFSAFMDALSVIFIEQIETDPNLAPHSTFILSATRFVIYSQFLSAFSTIKIDQMAQSFGIPEQLLREDLYAFGAHSNLGVRIEGEYITSTEIDINEKIYSEINEMGDALVLRIRRLLPLIK